MFKKRFRLPPENFKPEKSFVSPFYVLRVARNNESGPRIGIVVSKNVSKKSVTRNKIKRTMRSFIEKNVRGGDKRDLLFIIKKEPENYEELYEEINKNL